MNLSHLDQAWESTPTPASKGNDTPLPPGKYFCKVDSGEVFESKDGRPFLKIIFVVADGDLSGTLFTKLYKLDDVERLSFLKKDLMSLGFNLGKLSDISQILSQFHGVEQNVAAVVKGEYTNYYLNGKPHKIDSDPKVPF